MSVPPPDPGPLPDPALNPYAAPGADLGPAPAGAGTDADLAQAEATRRYYLYHEVSVKSVGTLHYLAAVFAGLGLIGMAAAALSVRGNQEAEGLAGLVVFAVALYGGLFGLHASLGFGLRNLRPWARWLEVAVSGLGLAYIAVVIAMMLVVGQFAVGVFYLLPAAIPGYIVYLMLSAKGAMVFSPEYQEVIARTPHVKYRSSCLWILLAVVGVFLLLIILGAAVAIFGTRTTTTFNPPVQTAPR